MMRKRPSYFRGSESKSALMAIKGDRTLAEFSEYFNVQEIQIRDWKAQMLNQADTVFGSTREYETDGESHLKDLDAKFPDFTLKIIFLTKTLCC
jgi:transposase